MAFCALRVEYKLCSTAAMHISYNVKYGIMCINMMSVFFCSRNEHIFIIFTFCKGQETIINSSIKKLKQRAGICIFRGTRIYATDLVHCITRTPDTTLEAVPYRCMHTPTTAMQTARAITGECVRSHETATARTDTTERKKKTKIHVIGGESFIRCQQQTTGVWTEEACFDLNEQKKKTPAYLTAVASRQHVTYVFSE